MNMKAKIISLIIKGINICVFSLFTNKKPSVETAL
jgi:hypothetical protein